MKQLKNVELKRFKRKLKRPELEIVLVLENIQYATNVAGIFRTADAANIKEIYLTGISKTPPFGKDLQKASRSKEKSIKWTYQDTTGQAIQKLKKRGFKIIALELTDTAQDIRKFIQNNHDSKLAVILGSEVYGVTKATLAKSDSAVYIPMYGKGASLNVGVACGVLLYFLQLSQ